MELSDFLALLHIESGPNASGEYMCRCPAHDDRTASLCVTEGPMERGKSAGTWAIKFCCQAGCENAEIMRRLNVKPRDLYPASHADPSHAPKGSTAETVAAKPARKKKELGKLTTVYTYTDEQGKALFEVCRFERVDDETGKKEKSFVQRTYAPGDPKAKQDGYLYKTDNIRHPLYRLQAVVQAVADGRPVYVVEGEKDADNLTRLGLCATTNPGGASRKGLAVKWREEHTLALRNADVLLVPDIDETGMYDRRKVARLLVLGCKTVRLLDISKSARLPPNGDVSDLMYVVGDKRTLEILRELEGKAQPLSIAALDAMDAETGETSQGDPDWEKAAARMNAVPGYCVEDGCICRWESEESHRKLCTFLAVPVAEISRDDGISAETLMVIDGYTRHGHHLPQVRVSSKAYERMGWVMDNWGFYGNMMPGNSIKDNLRYAIAAAGEKDIQRYTEYNHTGWRKIGGRWAFLYQGGAIGVDNVTVELGDGLHAYQLDGGGDPAFEQIDLSSAILSSLMLRESVKPKLMTPLLAMVYLAPLKEFMDRKGCSPSFSLFLVGVSGSGKSVASALALSHFGSFTYKTLPASFRDTSNYTQEKAFLLKDVPIVVDDYHPASSMQERRKMENTAQSLSRTFGDNNSRRRMNADRTLSQAKPPRCVCIMSGESMPGIGDSGVARYYAINVEPEDVKLDETMTNAQELAQRGYLAKAMRGYIEWLLPQVDALPDKLAERFQELRTKAQKAVVKNAHARAPEAVACLMLGYEMMLNYMRDAGELTQEHVDRERDDAWDVLMDNSREQAEEAAEERPGQAFIRTLGEMLTARVAQVRDLTDSQQLCDPSRGMVGWMDEKYYYIMPDMAYALVSEQVRKKGLELQLPQRSLYRQMRFDRIIVPPPASKTYTYPKRVRADRPAERVLYIPRRAIDGDLPAEEQLRIEGAMLVSDEQIPF
ncbi:MAG: hypothetical protein RSE23_01740 [Clostridia bacterium]